MIVSVACAALAGVEAFKVDLEVDLARQGMPGFSMVGLADNAVREGRERVFSALRPLSPWSRVSLRQRAWTRPPLSLARPSALLRVSGRPWLLP